MPSLPPDVAEAEAAIERLLRVRALLAQAHGDEAGHREYWDRYRDMARSLGFEGHIAWAGAMA